MFIVTASVVIIAALISLLLSPQQTQSAPFLLRQLAQHQFAWGQSTTQVPISTVSVLAKRLLSRDPTLPPALLAAVPPADTIPMQAVRDYTNAQRLERIKDLCAHYDCQVSEVDHLYKLTPLHIAALSGDVDLMDYLRQHGAVPTPDHVGRKPANLTFENFIANAKRAAREEGRQCEFPVVHFDGSNEAMDEARRLVGEGEPVLLRGAFWHYASQRKAWDVGRLVGEFGDMNVTVGAVPYAAAFDLEIREMPLKEFYNKYMGGEGMGERWYVFNKGAEVCREGYDALARMVEEVFPKDLVEHPDVTGGVEGIHFFLGGSGSGAPFHIHADAVNAAVGGRKRWFVFTPRKTLYSRKTIHKWVEEDYEQLAEEDRPLECIQTPGDIVYVPLDWGHAVLNLDDNTFGYALELLNHRDTFSHLWR